MATTSRALTLIEGEMNTIPTARGPEPTQSNKTPFWQHFGEYAFRPLFFLLVIHAVALISFWTLAWSGVVIVAWPRNPIYWHAHEMLSGFAGAAIAGFLLTAVSNWTSRPPVGGLRLLLLCVLWSGARLSLFAPWAHAAFDVGFWLMLLGLMSNEVVAAANRRNYKILIILAVLALSDAAWHLAELSNSALLQQSTWAQLWLVIILISVMGGRVIPAFTGNWLRLHAAQQGAAPLTAKALPPAFNRLDLVSIVSLLVFALCTLMPAPAWLTFTSGLVAAALHAWRLSRWQGYRCLSDPLIWMLHLSYAWIPVGLALTACAAAGWLPVSAGLHALTVGCVAGMIISVSARAALGHSKRALRSHPLLTSAIVLVNLGAVLRVAAAISGMPLLMSMSALMWVFAFLCYGAVYVPILLVPAAR